MRDPEERDERAQSLRETLTSPGWKEVALPALRRRLQTLEQSLALVTRDIEGVRFEQGYYRALYDLVEAPERYLRLYEP